MTKFIGIIPARYASTRFPGKPLAMLGDAPVIEHVYNRASQCLDEVLVATDDERILNAVKKFGGNAVMTSSNHRSGTDRCCEAYKNVNSDADVVINIQGDEPFIDPSQIEALKKCFDDETTQIATLARHFDVSSGFEGLSDPNLVKLVFSDNGKALYFSRSVIPFVRGCAESEWLSKAEYFTHVGIYAYKASVLEKLAQLEQTTLEKAESLEQLRWLQNGYNIKVALTDCSTIGIDTPADLENARIYLKKNYNHGC